MNVNIIDLKKEERLKKRILKKSYFKKYFSLNLK
jgi:hypothetical protein